MEPIIIAGAGIGGLSAAIALVRHGFAVRVYERAAQLREFGAGIQLGPNAFRMFERLGVQHAMQEIAFEPRAIVLMDSVSGSEICRQRVTESFRRQFGYPYRVGHRADVQKVLLQAARGYPDSLELRLGESVRSFTQTKYEVTVTLESGATSAASALIGADGLWSVVRQAILGDGSPRVSGHIAYRAVLSATEIPGDLLSDNVEVWVGPRHHLVCYQVSGGKSLNIVAIFHSSRYLEGWDTSGDAAELNAGFADACFRVRRLLSFVQTWRMWVLCDRVLGNPTTSPPPCPNTSVSAWSAPQAFKRLPARWVRFIMRMARRVKPAIMPWPHAILTITSPMHGYLGPMARAM